MADQFQQPFQSTLQAGDDWAWSVSLPDYPPATFDLKYFLRGPAEAGTLDITAAADSGGNGYAIAVDGADTENLPAGLYVWQMCVVKKSDSTRTTLGRGQVGILADIASETAPVDGRSYVKKTLDAIQANIQGTAGRVEKQYMLAGRELQLWARKELLEFEAEFITRYKREQLESGQVSGDRNLVYAGFRNAESGVGVWNK